MSKKKIIIGNWKMNPATPADAENIFKGIKRIAERAPTAQTIICPPYIFIEKLLKLKGRSKKIQVGAQDMSEESSGAFTGEISGNILKNLGATYVILGHSERRKRGETDELINKKVLQALEVKLTPIICIGEKVRDEDGKYLGFIKSQLDKALYRVPVSALNKIIIAYEPIWAIGATQAMNPHDIHGTTILIRRTLIDLFKTKQVKTPILYGGSVDPQNARGILTEGEADGLLIGRQSLDPKSFSEIIQLTRSL
jgi:triosephosphate isomerase